MNVAIIGAGFIGRKRAAAINKQDKLLVIGDNDLKSAKNLASEYSCLYTDQIKNIVNNNIIDTFVFIVTSAIKLFNPVKNLFWQNSSPKRIY